MNSPASRSRLPPTILCSGLLAGALDITAAFLVYGYLGAKPIPLLQGIAAGALGPRSFNGGLATAALGLFFQFLIATIWATVYVIASRSISFLITNAPLAGALYGILVYFFMNRIVVPLSAARKYPFTIRGMVIGAIIHIVCVGLPIALITRRFARNA
ncbi:MAG: hypothetical protein ACRD3B_01790 [Candidatus Sulfotelmatobacter sp.]